jgi:hypothetical protein
MSGTAILGCDLETKITAFVAQNGEIKKFQPTSAALPLFLD